MLDSIEDALMELSKGKMIVVVDDEHRENEGDLLMDAACATSEAINFMAQYGRGLICVPMEESRLAELSLGPMTAVNSDSHGTAFTVSVDHCETTTGISAHERARTIRALAGVEPGACSTGRDFRKPGHIFPLAARTGGVLVRRGHTEAAVDLARLAREYARKSAQAPSGVICEIMNADGTMARLPELKEFAAEHSLKLISIENLVQWRRRRELLVKLEAETVLPTEHGIFRLYAFTEIHTGREHLALVMGDLANNAEEAPLVRIHSECLTGDAIGSKRCDCGDQYDEAMRRIGKEGRGVLVYLRQEGRGIGLVNKMKAYALQDSGLDTVDANTRLGFKPDERDYAAGASILKELGCTNVKLMTNNPAKAESVSACGITVSECLPIVIPANAHNSRYLATKETRMRHRMKGDIHEYI